MRMGCATPGVAPLMQSGILADRRLPPMISAFPFVKYNKQYLIFFYIKIFFFYYIFFIKS